MADRLRIVLISRRFWPLVGGAEVVMSNLATGLTMLQQHPQVVTAQWESHWPVEVVHRETTVYRLPNPRQRGWGTFRYMTSLGRWLRSRRDQIDAVVVSMLKHDAYAAVKALQGSGIPVLLRGEGAGETGDCHWQETANFGQRIRRRCQQADAVIAPSPAIGEELRQAGYAADRVHVIANGVRFSGPRSADRRRDARQALADANPDMQVSGVQPVVLYTGRLHENKGLHELVTAWSNVRNKYPLARLWLIGEGPARERLFQQINSLGLRGQVLMPGVFDELDEVLMAVDMFVLPSYEEGMSLSLLEAMGAELPVVATNIEGNRLLVTDGDNGRLVEPRDFRALQAALLELLADAATRARLAQRARESVVDHYGVEQMADHHLQLIRQLQS